jgi:hypothetical protein
MMGEYPQKRELYDKLAAVMDVQATYLASEEDEFITEAAARFGIKGERDAK